MLSRLTRIFLALVTAFVFTGQMEAAAQHCARLAKAAATADTAAPPCHESNASVHDTHMAMDHHAQPAPDHSGHAPSTKSPPHCECIAALTGWTGAIGATTSTHVESYAWLTPAEAPFASAKPDPDFRPPRA